MDLKEILIVVEKSPIFRKISRILQDLGYLVILAPNALSACGDLHSYQFDLILVSLVCNEADKLNLMRWARKSSPQTKLIVVGNPNLTLPAEVFQIEVEDYLLMPFTAMELFTRVDRCLNGNRFVRGSNEEKTEQINANVLNSFRHKIRNIHNGLLS
jgi:PleD family two-component response regulator